MVCAVVIVGCIGEFVITINKSNFKTESLTSNNECYVIPVSDMSSNGQKASPSEKSGSNASTPSAIRLRSGACMCVCVCGGGGLDWVPFHYGKESSYIPAAICSACCFSMFSCFIRSCSPSMNSLSSCIFIANCSGPPFCDRKQKKKNMRVSE